MPYSTTSGSDHLQLIKFWSSRAPGKGVCGGAKISGSALLQPARSVCVSLSVFLLGKSKEFQGTTAPHAVFVIVYCRFALCAFANLRQGRPLTSKPTDL